MIVLGAGAAGLFCAAQAVRRGRSVLVIDHAATPGAKILISGGGRCNFTNRMVKAENFLSENPHFCKSALAGFQPGDFIAFVEGAGIAYHEKHLGQLFCDGKAQQILDLLLGLCAGVELRMGVNVSGVSKADRFLVESDHGNFEAGALVVATGGLSIPKIGASGFGYEVARKFGLSVVAPRAGLVPFVFDEPVAGWMRGLAGVSFEAEISCGKRKFFREGALFTHRGMSGPAVLQISSYWREGEGILVDMAPGVDVGAWLKEAKKARGKAAVKTVLGELLPARLAEAVVPGELAGAVIGGVADKALEKVALKLQRFEVRPSGTEGFAKAEVTVGGVDTAGLSSKTMEAKGVPKLFFVGEVVDVTGWLGGYNFQWAWASGFAAGNAV